MNKRSDLPDAAARHEAIHDRTHNVVIDAGAGTGKTTLIVRRLIELVAPTDPDATPLPLRHLAAVTFTRRAAGELRLRIRESLLALLAHEQAPEARRQQAKSALADLDIAYVGTIHSFADRLLRLRPQQARISPAYEIADDDEPLLFETYQRLVQASERGDLPALLHGTRAAPHAEQAQAALRDALGIGLRRYTLERENNSQFGLDALIRGFIETRDVDVAVAAGPELDLRALRACMREVIDCVRHIRSDSYGGGHLHALAAGLHAVLTESDPGQVSAEIVALLDRHLRSDWTKRDAFNGDTPGFEAYKRCVRGTSEDGETRPPLRARIDRIVGGWIGPQLLHARPVALELYEQVKRRHQLTDHLDLLIKLRDVLRDDLPSRKAYQSLFQHIFVDELQDTDPLQAEIIAYLCEATPRARDWRKVLVAPARVTIVGDPKQSIYRFRRADVEVYDQIRALLTNAQAPSLHVELQANFRSRATLIRWFNHRFDTILGTGTPDKRFDPETGTIFNRHLAPGLPADKRACVHVVPFQAPEGSDLADPYRALEGEAMAHYLKWLVEQSGTQITDPITGAQRNLEYGDIAILCLATTKLHHLFPELDKLDVPYSARGATLFLSDPLHQQFLLALRALADRNDGVAAAALLRPPFFAIDLHDLVLERVAPDDEPCDDPDSPVARVRAAKQLIAELRRKRFARSPGSTARDLLDRTALGPSVATGPSGAQRLAGLRELCLIVGQIASDDGLDYDGVTAQLREYVDNPIQLDPPHPVASEAIAVMTVHQAKGLEFPVVVFWDGHAKFTDVERNTPFRVARDGSAWAIKIDKLAHEVSAEGMLKDREQQYRLAERRRLVYVLGTRAREILVLPQAGPLEPDKYICDALIHESPKGTTLVRPAYGSEGTEPWWVHDVVRTPSLIPPRVGEHLEERWARAAEAAMRSDLEPIAVSDYSALASSKDAVPLAIDATTGPGDEETALPEEPIGRAYEVKRAPGRFGAAFGIAVHRALELVLGEHEASPEVAVERAIAETALEHNHAEVLGDVQRALARLRDDRLLPEHGRTVALEYPVAGATPDARHLNHGLIDFVSTDGATVDIIDFKTDAPPHGAVELSHPRYVEQVRCYAGMVAAPRLRVGRIGLLFTADGQTRWLPFVDRLATSPTDLRPR